MKTDITDSLSNKFANMAIVCSFLVAVIHCRPPFEVGTMSWWIKQMLECGICTIAVPFFFTASGFFLAGHFDEEGWHAKEVRKRMRTLLIPYFLWITLFLVFLIGRGLLQGRWYGQFVECSNLIHFYGLALTGCPGLTPLWYVRGLFILVLLSPLLFGVARIGSMALLGLFVVYIGVCPGPAGGGFIHGLTRCGIFPLAGLFYFTLGISLRIGKICLQYSVRKCMVAGFAGLMLLAFQAWATYKGYGYAQYLGCLGIPFVLYSAFGVMTQETWPKWLTSCAFPIYLIHKFFYGPIPNALWGGSRTLIGYFLTAVFVFVMSILVARALRRFLPRFASFAFGGR